MSATPSPGPFDPVVAALEIRSLIESIPLFAWQAILLGAVAVSIAILYRVARPGGRWGQRLRTRFVLGLPWGTLLGLGVVVIVYLFVQGGLGNQYDPVSLPFRATSYAYPLGVLLAGFSHLGWGHLLGNLLSGLVYGSIAEYAWSHYPTDRGSQSFTVRLSNPFVRIGLFTGGIVLAGLVTAAFSWGPIIGFSGVVYALAGFALVCYPIATIVAVAGWSHLWHLWGTFVDPYSIAEPTVRYSGVGWANTAVQGHAFGFLIGILVAAVVIRRRDRSADPGRIWLATMVYAIANGLWSIYWYLGNNQYVRLEGIGTAVLFILAGLIVLAVSGSDRPLLDRFPGIDVSPGQFEFPSGRRIAAGVIVFSLIGMSMVGAAVNLSAPSGVDMPENAVEIRDYQVAYVENVTNQQLAVVDVPFLDQVTAVRTSGVVVYSEQRNLWHQVVSKRALEARGSERVLLGGIGWRQDVAAYRAGWSVIGGNVTYRVFLRPGGGDERLVYTSNPAIADVILSNRTVTIRPAREAFEVVVARDNETLGARPLPDDGGNVTVGGIRFDRSSQELYASINGTQLRVASRRVPPTRQ
ncbi:rhomboid family intramembrane serine protease [Halorhabdus amylolytica]|uniref:rhomboid family intramembrane serine protease n=1 Tax=Halorhabdus amylolytica TaxID=2559573 RepID=UPI0010AA48EA|nr:rhomboid family intramembrane serine protease [Halorhabdus amylolytica]